MTLATMSNNILKFCPGLNLDIIKSNIQDSYRMLCAKDWNRLKLQRQIYTVAPYSTGSVAVAAATGIVTGVGTTFTAAMVGRFMRVSYGDSFFEIETYSSPTSLTLRSWAGVAVAAGTAYSIFKTIYPADATFKLIYELEYQTTLRKRSQRYFNNLDPARLTTSSTPIAWAFAGTDATGIIQVELYPVPSAIVPVRVYGKVLAETLADSGTPKLPEDLIEAHALIACYRMKALKEPQQGWEDKLTMQAAFYASLLGDFEEEDFQLDDHSDKVKDRMGEAGYPTDDNFGLSHDIEG